MPTDYKIKMGTKNEKERISTVLSRQRDLMFDKYLNLLNRDTQLNTNVTKTIETQINLCV